VPVDILMVCVDSTAGVMNGLCEAINQHTPYHARFIRARDNWLQYPADLTFSEDKDQLPRILSEVKVLHWNIFSQNHFNSYYPFNRRGLSDKTHVRHFHGTLLRRTGKIDRHNYHTVFVSTPDLLHYCPTATWLPNPIYVPYENDISYPDEFTILHMPATSTKYAKYKRLIQDPEFYPSDYPEDKVVKGTDLLRDAVKAIQNDGEAIALDQGRHVPFKAALNLKAGCSVFFDQLWSGVYGCSAIEGMYMRKPVMCRISKDTEAKMKDLWLDEELPFLNVGYKDLKADIKKHMGIDVKAVGDQSHDWVVKAHSPERIAKRYIEEVGL
jgi:hypothetical protein